MRGMHTRTSRVTCTGTGACTVAEVRTSTWMPSTLRPDELRALGGVPGRDPGYVRLRQGVWIARGVPPDQPDVRIAAVAAQLPEHAVIGGWSAARLHERDTATDGVDVFDGGPLLDERPVSRRPARVVVVAARESRLVTRADVRILRSPASDDERTAVGGIGVTTPLRTALDLARLLPVPRAVVALDRLRALQLVTANDIRTAFGARRFRGRAAGLAALSLSRDGVESPRETLLRLVWRSAGLPEPVVNAQVWNADGEFVARVDLLDPLAGVVGEYDGAVHASAERRSRDARRQEALEALGLVVVRVGADDLDEHGHGVQVQHRLRDAYRRAALRAVRERRWVVTPGGPEARSDVDRRR